MADTTAPTAPVVQHSPATSEHSGRVTPSVATAAPAPAPAPAPAESVLLRAPSPQPAAGSYDSKADTGAAAGAPLRVESSDAGPAAGTGAGAATGAAGAGGDANASALLPGALAVSKLDPAETRALAEKAAEWRHLYTDKAILAPMVRCGTLPLRLQAVAYGADLVYTEELIDFKMCKTKRVVNEEKGLVEWIAPNGEVVLQTHPAEAGRNVLQLGSSNAERALAAAKLVENDFLAVDINMGCPKHFSIQAGMGAALLKTPEVSVEILRTLRKNLKIPVTCKIRLFHDPAYTIDYAKAMQDAGAVALGVHMRYVEDRPRHPAKWEKLRPVVEALSIPVIANGDVWTRADMESIKSQSGCSSVMLARPALRDTSVFRPGGVLPPMDVLRDYMRHASALGNRLANTKFTLNSMLKWRTTQTPEEDGLAAKIQRARTPRELGALLAMEDEVVSACAAVGVNADEDPSFRRKKREMAKQARENAAAKRSRKQSSPERALETAGAGGGPTGGDGVGGGAGGGQIGVAEAGEPPAKVPRTTE